MIHEREFALTQGLHITRFSIYSFVSFIARGCLLQSNISSEKGDFVKTSYPSSVTRTASSR